MDNYSLGSLNKDIAGYLILLILAEADGDFDPREGVVVVQFLQQEFPLGGNFESAAEIIGMLKPEDYESALLQLAEKFYADSTEYERKKFIEFAIKLVKADKELEPLENKFVTLLFDAWDI